jgi:predicted ATPase with chaperone activity
MRERIERARGIQQARGYANAELPPKLLCQFCRLDDAGERTLGLSARAHVL